MLRARFATGEARGLSPPLSVACCRTTLKVSLSRETFIPCPFEPQGMNVSLVRKNQTRFMRARLNCRFVTSEQPFRKIEWLGYLTSQVHGEQRRISSGHLLLLAPAYL